MNDYLADVVVESEHATRHSWVGQREGSAGGCDVITHCDGITHCDVIILTFFYYRFKTDEIRYFR